MDGDRSPNAPTRAEGRAISSLVPDKKLDVEFIVHQDWVLDDEGRPVRKVTEFGTMVGLVGTPRHRTIRIIAGEWEDD